MCVY
jgi:chromosome segregation ATPase